ncbi:MAG: DnaJ domain-containing protein [Crocinitomicaceae bacterium]
MKDYYKILELNRSCTCADVRKSYRVLARKLHPDVNDSPDAHEKFIELTEANEVLKDPIRKYKYDILYDRYILNKKSDLKDSNRTKKWQKSTQNKSQKGRNKGQRYAQMKNSKFQKKTRNWENASGLVDFLDFILNIFTFFM